MRLLFLELRVLLRKHVDMSLHGCDLNFEKRNLALFLGKHLIFLLSKGLNEQKLLRLLLAVVIFNVVAIGAVLNYERVCLHFAFPQLWANESLRALVH